MSVQYLSNEKGEITAVQLSIKEWKMLKNKYPDIDHLDSKLPQWHKDIIDARVDAIEKNPGLIIPISGLIDELDK